jgi:hypothetical protein
VPAVRRFVGLAGYYCDFVAKFATIAEPLTRLLRHDQPWTFAAEQQSAFGQLWDRLTSAPVLTFPDFDKMFFVKPDWSAIGLGAVLCQLDDDGKEHPIAFLFRRCRGKETSYCARRGELVAI